MESYDEYHSQAKLLANIHARPKPQQLALMKSHYSEIEDEISTFKPKQEQNLVKQDFNQGTTIQLFSENENKKPIEFNPFGDHQSLPNPGVLGMSSLNNNSFPATNMAGSVMGMQESKGAVGFNQASTGFGENSNKFDMGGFENNGFSSSAFG